jgi:hypothetical protein
MGTELMLLSLTALGEEKLNGDDSPYTASVHRLHSGHRNSPADGMPTVTVSSSVKHSPQYSQLTGTEKRELRTELRIIRIA